MRVVITGGHHSSALPVIDVMRQKNDEFEIYWIGHRKSVKGNVADTLEYIEITSLGIPFYDLKAGKLYRANSLFHYLKLPFGAFQALYLLLKIKPDVIVSFGGYLAAPVVLSGWLLGIPSITHEQTVVAGYSNKLISLLANKILLSFKESEKYFPDNKTSIVGLPLRKSIKEINSDIFPKVNNLPFILVLGGKTGAHVLNTLVEDSLEIILSFSNIIHQTGDHTRYKDFERLSEKYLTINKKVFGAYYPKKFIFNNEIGEAFNRSDVVVSRAGAHVVGELKYLNKKCVLIPISWVSHNEQYENAKILENTGQALVLDQENLSRDQFVGAIKEMLKKNWTVSENMRPQPTLPEILIVQEIEKFKKI